MKAGFGRFARKAASAACILCVVGAIALAAYPFLADRYGSWQASRQFTLMRDAHAGLSAYDESLIAEAEAYNAALAGETPWDGRAVYAEQLAADGSGIICWLEVPKLGLKEPVYRGSPDTIDSALMAGAAHVEGTSLPVGGASANTVLTGHSGMRHTRMFDQLDQLEVGDSIIIWTLGVPYAYEVSGSQLVLPGESGVMDVVKGEDRCTLITCRPIGVNTHRLVVTAQRVPYSAEMEQVSVAYLADPRLAWFVASIAMAAILVWIAVLGARRRARRSVGPSGPRHGIRCPRKRDKREKGA